MNHSRRLPGPGAGRTLLAVAAVGAVGVAAGLAWAGGTVVGPPVERAKTLTVPADGAQRLLFKIGDSRLAVRCDVEDDPKSPELGGIVRRLTVKAGPAGAVIAAPEWSAELLAGETEALLIDAIPPGAVNASFTPFAVFDGSGTTASGTASLLADGPAQECRTTAQVAG